MKNKILTFVSITFLALMSCSSDDSPTQIDNPKLPITQKFTYSRGGTSLEEVEEVEEYIYDTENRLIQVKTTKDGNYYANLKLIYNNNKLVKLDRYFVDNQTTRVAVLEYTGNNITKKISYSDNLMTIVSEEEYVYDSQNKIIQLKRTGYYNNQVTTSTTNFEYLPNNIVKETKGNINEYYTIQYDDKNNPFSDISSLSDFLRISPIGIYNRISYKEYFNGQVNQQSNYTNTYDSDGFLVTQVQVLNFINASSSNTREYTYNR